MSIRKIAFIALLALSVSVFARENTTSVTGRAESPTDGSLWIGTDGDGLFRLGRNGRRMWYNVESGHLASDHIKTLAFDNDKVLWILDDSGVLTKYTAVAGFKQDYSFPEGISAFCISQDLRTMYLCSSNSQFWSYDISSGTLSQPSSLPSNVTAIFPSVEENVLWAMASGAIMKISPDGSVLKWEDVDGSLNLLPFEFDTNVPQDTVEAWTTKKILVVILGILLLIAVVSVLYRFLFYGRSKPKETRISDEPVVEVENPEIPLENTSSITLGGPDTTDTRARVPIINDVQEPKLDGEFTKTVLDLIQKNLSNPDFDVDTIATMTGVSRIHVNRKLKAEGSPSPSVLLKDARMALASKLLREGKLTVKEVGAACGFSRPSYFATAFKEYFNVSPSDYQGAVEA
jgi:AraC-like DNA-binding protein